MLPARRLGRGEPAFPAPAHEVAQHGVRRGRRCVGCRAWPPWVGSGWEAQALLHPSFGVRCFQPRGFRGGALLRGPGPCRGGAGRRGWRHRPAALDPELAAQAFDPNRCARRALAVGSGAERSHRLAATDPGRPSQEDGHRFSGSGEGDGCSAGDCSKAGVSGHQAHGARGVEVLAPRGGGGCLSRHSGRDQSGR